MATENVQETDNIQFQQHSRSFCFCFFIYIHHCPIIIFITYVIKMIIYVLDAGLGRVY